MINFIGNSGIFSESNCSIEQALSYLKTKKILAYDSETEGFMWFTDKIVMAQIGDDKQQFIFDTRTIDINCLKEILEDPSILKIGHNIKFDYKFLKTIGIEMENVYDTMVAECLLDAGNVREKGYYSLGEVANRYLNVQLDKSVRNQFINLQGKPFTEKQIVYGAKDVEYLLEIRKLQLGRIAKMDLLEVLELESETVLVLGDIEYNGMLIDSQKWLEIANITENNTIEQEKKLDSILISDSKLKHLVPNSIQTNLFDFEERLLKLNWSSPKQVLNVIKDLGFNIKSVDAKELKLIENKHILIKEFINYQKQRKLAETYGKTFLKHINKTTGKVHQDIFQIVDTGRMSSSNPNLQNIPSKGELAKLMRAAFISNKGKKLVGGDYSACELSFITEYSQDPEWLKEFRGEGKLHDKVACMMFDIEMHQVKDCPDWLYGASYRDVAKTIDFGLANKMTEFKLSNVLQISKDKAKNLIDKFFIKFPTIGLYLDGLGLFGQTYGYMKTSPPYSRIRQFPEWKELKVILHKNKYNKVIKVSSNEEKGFIKLGNIERAARNLPMQGGNASLTKKALVELRKEIKKNNYPVIIINAIHDEVITECDEDFSVFWRTEMSRIMTECGKLFIKTIPLKVECKISSCWEK